jgi:hypothetical protein
MSGSFARAIESGGELDGTRMTRTEWGYELKFRVSDDMADQAIAWAREILAPDPYADAGLGDGYRTSTLYFDTPTLDVFHRQGPDRRRKYRVRRYGSETLLYLERKLKSNGRVRKYRSSIPEEDLARLGDGHADPDWSGDWFRRRVRARQLAPVCQVTYDRVARVGELGGQPARLTVDRPIRCALAEGLSVTEATDGAPLLTGEAILELKFPKVMPLAFKELLRELSLSPGPVSKYRLGLIAWGLRGVGKDLPVAKRANVVPRVVAGGLRPAPAP